MNFRTKTILAGLVALPNPIAGVAWASGLALVPPAGHIATKASPDPGYTEAFEVTSIRDADAGCQVQLQPAGSTGATQAQLNAIAATPAYVQVVQQFLGLRFDIDTTAPYTLGDVRGVQVTGTAKGGAGFSTLATLFQTPKGKTVVVCVGPTARMGTLRPEFEAITRGVRLPR